MKALILAGGTGSRLRPLTHSTSKQLVPIANRPILAYVLDQALSLGVRDVGVIIEPKTGPDIQASVERYFETASGNVTFLLQEKPLGLAHAAKVAFERGFLEDGDDVVMMLGDNLVGGSLGELSAKFTRSDASAMLLTKLVDDPGLFGVVVREGERVARLVEKPKQLISREALVGVYFFRSDPMRHAIAAILPSARGELEITDALQYLVEGSRVIAEPVPSYWLDVGKKDSLLLANRTVLLDRHWTVPKSASVVASDIGDSTAVGEEATITRSLVTTSSIGDGATVVGCSLHNCVVLEGASLFDVGLHDSVIGRRSHIARRGDLVLNVGDDTELEI